MNSCNILERKKRGRHYSPKITDRANGWELLSEVVCSSCVVPRAFVELVQQFWLHYNVPGTGLTDGRMWCSRHTPSARWTHPGSATTAEMYNGLHADSTHAWCEIWLLKWEHFCLGISWKKAHASPVLPTLNLSSAQVEFPCHWSLTRNTGTSSRVPRLTILDFISLTHLWWK